MPIAGVMRLKKKDGSKVEAMGEDSRLKSKDINKGESSRIRRRNGGDKERKKIDTTNRSHKHRDPSKKCVRWHPKVAKKRHIQVKDMSEEEIESVWYNEKDTKIILAMAKVTVKMMMKGEICDDVDYCSRGLEGKTLKGSRRRNKCKQIVRSAVLTEQEIQRMDGANDPVGLARASLRHTEELAESAYERAMKDEIDARQYLNGMHTSFELHKRRHPKVMRQDKLMDAIPEAIPA